MYTSYDLVNGSALLGRKTLSSHKLSFFFYFFINPPSSAAAEWMAIKYIPEVWS